MKTICEVNKFFQSHQKYLIPDRDPAGKLSLYGLTSTFLTSKTGNIFEDGQFLSYLKGHSSADRLINSLNDFNKIILLTTNFFA